MYDPNEDFEVSRLLAWKKHEQPPPGYFLRFSGQVLAKIRLEERRRQTAWWRLLLAQLDPKPLLVSAYGLAVCLLLFLGVNVAVTDEADLRVSSFQSAIQAAANPFTTEDPPIAIHFSSLGPMLSTMPVASADHSSFPFSQFQQVRFTSSGLR